MARKRYTEEQIIVALNEAESRPILLKEKFAAATSKTWYQREALPSMNCCS